MMIKPHKAFSFLTRKFAHIERFGNMKAMRDFLDSKEYRDNNSALAPMHVMPVSKAMAKALTAVDKKQPLPIRIEKGWRTWTPERIELLKAADAKHGNDEGIARELGLSLGAARAARWRYVGKRAGRNFDFAITTKDSIAA